MRARTLFPAFAVIVLCLGVFSAEALGGKKKRTAVVVNAGSVLSGKQTVKVRGGLNTAAACRATRSMRLFLTDQTGAILATLDSATSDAGGNWRLQAKLPSPPNGTQFLQVKAKKLATGKLVCRAGLSPLIPIS
jgi:hypothetical protein